MATVSEDTSLQITLTANEKKLVEQAAALSSRPIADFTTSAAVEAARRALEEDCSIQLSDRDRDRLFELLENPPEPNERLKAAARWHKENVVQ